MDQNKENQQQQPDYGKARKAAIITFFVLIVVIVGLNVLFNVIDGKPPFEMPGVFVIVADILIVLSGTYSVFRNVANGKKWFK